MNHKYRSITIDESDIHQSVYYDLWFMRPLRRVRDCQVTYTLESPIWVLVTEPVPQMMKMPEGVARPYFETLDEIEKLPASG